jgi:alanyl aminopeptidase
MSRSCWLVLSLVPALAVGASPEFALPDGVTPVKHTIELTIDPARNIFQGWMRIEVELQKAQSEVWLNGKDLAIERSVIEFHGKAYNAHAHLIGGEFIRLKPGRRIGPGRALLSIRYRARLSDKADSGPFRRQVEGRSYAFTVFTPIDARRAFPCFDEPRFKTPWDVSIRVKRLYRAFANAPQMSETEERGGTKLVRFAPTQPLPAEVVAFAVGPFDVWDGGDAGVKHTPVRVITLLGHREEGEEAALATREVLPALEKYTGLPYPWEKLDHIALPAGAFGATENPGLITYRSRTLLIEPGGEDPERLRALYEVEAHEIAHQWFGNMVTQSTWQDVWLSEGFATWMAAKMMDQQSPDARKDVSAVAARERIMEMDARPKARPVRVAMKSRSDMKSVYSQIVYQKGAAVLLMLEHWIGEGRFQSGLQTYLRAHAFANASTVDLGAALAIAAGVDPLPVMHSFLDQAGVPSIRGTVDCSNEKTPHVVIEQIGSTNQWVIPVCWRNDTAETTCTVLDRARKEISLPAKSSCPAWIFWNAGGAGYYRTAWSRDQLIGIGDALDRLSSAERLTLACDLAVEKAPAEAIFSRLLSDPEPEIAQAARTALGFDDDPKPQRRR